MGFAEVPQPMQYAPRENLGVTLANAVGTAFQGYQAGKANESNQAFQTAFGQAYAKGDYNAMQQLAAQYPQQWQTVQQGMTVINQNNRQALGNAASDLSLAAASGDPQAVASVAAAHAPVLQGIGVNPDQIVAAYQQNPQQVRQYADMVGMHALEPKDYFTLQNQQLTRLQQGQYQQGQLQLGAQRTQIQQQQADQQAAYQQGQLQQGQQRINLESSFNQAKMFDMQEQRALQRNKSQADIQSAQTKSLQAKQGLIDAYDSVNNNLATMQNTLDQVKAIPPDTFNGLWGLQGKVNRNLPGSDSASAWAAIQGMQSQARLQGIVGLKGTGPVSDAEGQAAAKAFLNINENTDARTARTAIDNWQAVLKRQATYQQSRSPQIELYRQQVNNATQQQQQQLNGAQGYAGAPAGSTVDWSSLQH